MIRFMKLPLPHHDVTNLCTYLIMAIVSHSHHSHYKSLFIHFLPKTKGHKLISPDWTCGSLNSVGTRRTEGLDRLMVRLHWSESDFRFTTKWRHCYCSDYTAEVTMTSLCSESEIWFRSGVNEPLSGYLDSRMLTSDGICWSVVIPKTFLIFKCLFARN